MTDQSSSSSTGDASSHQRSGTGTDSSSEQYSNSNSNSNNDNSSNNGNNPKKDCPVINAEVTMKSIHSEWTKLYTEIAQVYKFEHPRRKTKLTLGGIIQTINNRISFKWTLYYLNKANEKVIDYKYTQVVIAYTRYQDINHPIITLRNQHNTDLIKEIVKGFQKLGVLCEKVGNTETEKQDILIRNAELQRKSEIMRLEEERKKRIEQERKRLPPMIPPPSFDDQDYVNEPNMGLGGISLSDLLSRCRDNDSDVGNSDDASSSAGNSNKNSNNNPKVHSSDEEAEANRRHWSEQGKATFKRDRIHAQTWEFYNRITQYFAPVRACLVKHEEEHKSLLGSILSSSSSNKAAAAAAAAHQYKMKLHSTIFVMNDVQYDFENNFETLSNVNKFIVHVFPLSFSTANSSLHIRSYDTGSFVEIERPQFFGFLAEVKNKEDCGYVFHCTSFAQKENSVHFEYFINSQDEAFVRGLAAAIWQYRGGLVNANNGNGNGDNEADDEVKDESSSGDASVSNNNNNTTNNSEFVRAQAGVDSYVFNQSQHSVPLAQHEADLINIHIETEEDNDNDSDNLF